MKKRSIGLIIGLMGFALLGVVAMQYFFLRQSYHMQSELFDRDVHEALNTVVSKLEKKDANRFIDKQADSMIVKQDRKFTKTKVKKFVTDSSTNTTATQSRKQHDLRIAKLRDSLKYIILRTKLDEELYGLPQEEMVNVKIQIEEFVDEFGILHQNRGPLEITKLPPTKRGNKVHKYDTTYQHYLDPQFGPQVVARVRINPYWQREHDRKVKERKVAQIKQMLRADSLAKLNQKETEVTLTNFTVMQNLAEEYKNSGQPLKDRINTLWIDSLLRFELHNKGIMLPFSYEVSTANNDSLIFSKAYDMVGEKPVFYASETYQTPIFTKDVINDPGKIQLFFPDKNSHILSSMTYMLSISGGLLMVLIVCFGYTIFTILRQKKISEMKTDFINNMTHEFKTPVSTIMIASEALKDQEIIEDKARVTRLADIIYEENARLGSHIERVLNIARIEKNDFKLDKKPVDVNELITDVLDSMQLKLQKSNAQLDLHLDAEFAVIEADELHFANVIFNLIDNAVKYSKDEPELTISTLNKGSQLVIRVADKGIGMSRDQQAKIFEQFYRVPTGNLHDVKGFGLGLSYVNTIVKRLEGMISVRSEKEKGSEFELKFNIV
ncbi:HAMP domain-containing sensor histidine kinase [uncultured Mucilaginibacter sp.]|uniref:sensor histidine kinase n=1 Tax=uncultured Mucilaginibacter sp. TaxID=797541 RepID=UPI0025E66A61|nr:HAMP domain-containing sensor histidine kinase [uncultured Mucilaginibacter sp.]